MLVLKMLVFIMPISMIFGWESQGSVMKASTSVKSNLNIDSVFLNKNLPVYEVEPCLLELLVAVVKSNSKYYNPDKYFYSVIIRENPNYRYLQIAVEEWRDSKKIEYSGVVRINNTLALLRGDFLIDDLFKKKKNEQVKVKLSVAKKNIEEVPVLIEPSLQGTLNICHGLPFYVEVYTKATISGYDMKVKR